MTKTLVPPHVLPAGSTTTGHLPDELPTAADRPAQGTHDASSELLAATLAGKPVVRGLHSLVDSAQPAVVFTALARLLVPQLSDRCEVVIIEHDTPGYRIAVPERNAIQPTVTDNGAVVDAAPLVLSTPIVGLPGIGRAYFGTLLCHWDRARAPDAAEAALAKVAVGYAVAVVHYARLNSALDAAEADAVNLKVALASNREIGIAVGILMSRNLITRKVAFDLLRTVSQDRNRKLRDIAAEIAESGDLPC